LNLQYFKLKPDNIYSDIIEDGDEVRKVTVEGIDLLIFPHVYPSERFRTTKFLFESLKDVFRDKRICDMGCGPGIIGLYALEQGAEYVVQADINPIAVDNAKENNVLHGFSDDKVQAFVSDCFTNVPEQQFDIVVFNIPFHSEFLEIEDPLQYAFYDPNFQSVEKFLTQLPIYTHKQSKIFIAFSNKGNTLALEKLFGEKKYAWTLANQSNQSAKYDNRLYLLEEI
jgi:methylase of polypeptide subunit release factors